MRCISLDQIFHLAKQHLHKNCLGANPSTKQATKGRCEQNNEHDECDHSQSENEKILRPENFSENDKFGFRNIKKKQWPPIHINKGKTKKNEKETPTYVTANAVKSALWFLRINPFSFSPFINGRHAIPERFIF